MKTYINISHLGRFAIYQSAFMAKRHTNLSINAVEIAALQTEGNHTEMPK